MISLDLIIPIYKSKNCLEALIQSINDWVQNKKDAVDVQVIFVEDGGKDGTFEQLQNLSINMQFKSQLIRLTRNHGQHTAISIGIKQSNADFIAVMDDDLQHDPQGISLLLSQLAQENGDLIYGTYQTKQHSMVRNMASRLLKKITHNNHVDFKKVTSFKVMRKNVANSIKLQQSNILFSDVYFLECAEKILTYEVKHQKRIHGKSTYSNKKLIKLSIGIILFHSSLPLKFIVRLGIIMSLVFFILSCYFVYSKIVHNVPIGFTSIIVAIFLSTGLILVSLGIIGEYIRRIWVRQNLLEQVHIAENIRYDAIKN